MTVRLCSDIIRSAVHRGALMHSLQLETRQDINLNQIPKHHYLGIIKYHCLLIAVSSYKAHQSFIIVFQKYYKTLVCLCTY